MGWLREFNLDMKIKFMNKKINLNDVSLNLNTGFNLGFLRNIVVRNILKTFKMHRNPQINFNKFSFSSHANLRKKLIQSNLISAEYRKDSKSSKFKVNHHDLKQNLCKHNCVI